MPRIESFQLHISRLQCKKPFQIATGVSDVCHGVVLRLVAEGGLVGLGEGVPNPYLTSETLEGAVSALRLMLPALVGLDAWEVGEAHRRMAAMVSGHPSARAAVDIALHDLCARAAGVPLFRMLGGSRDRVETNYSIGLCPPGQAAQEARALVEAGYQVIKLKVGADPDDDVARVKAVRGALGPDLRLRIDANEGWSVTGALRALTRMEPFQVELAEQPVARWDLRGMATVRARVSIPIAADEAVRSPQDAARAIEAGAVDIINIKLMKSAGLAPAREIVALARTHGVALMVGGMVGESVIAVSAAAALAASARFEYADLDADLLLKDRLQIDGGAALDGCERVLGPAPGLGIAGLNAEFLREA